MKIKIIRKESKPFKGEDGAPRPYFWYIGEKADGSAVRFGSTDGEHVIGQEKDLIIEEYEQRTGNKGYKEIL